MRPLTYTKDSLLAIRKSVINTIHDKIDRFTWMKLNELNIAKKTKRGCRAGRRKLRPIKTIISDRTADRRYASVQSRSTNCQSATNAVNYRNLTYVRKTNLRVPCAKFATWNAQSIKEKRKSASIIDFVISNHLDILAVTETWLCGDDRDNRLLADLNQALPDHVFHHIPRGKRGGGVGVLLRKGFDVVVNEPASYRSFEYIDLTISSSSSSIRLFTIYRPYPAKTNKLTSRMFFEDFSDLVEMFTSLAVPLVVTGDFNLHMDVKDDHDAILMRDLLDSCCLEQHVTFRSFCFVVFSQDISSQCR